MAPSSARSRLIARLLRNAAVVVAVTAIFGFKAAERSALAEAAPLELASR